LGSGALLPQLRAEISESASGRIRGRIFSSLLTSEAVKGRECLGCKSLI
jgi:hypothetical protein